MAANPSWISTPKTSLTQVSSANSNLDGTGTLATVFSATSVNGTKLLAIIIKATIATTAGMVRLFYDNGTNVRLIREYSIPAITPSATIKAAEIIDVFDSDAFSLILQNGHSIKVSTENAETFNVFGFFGEF